VAGGSPQPPPSDEATGLWGAFNTLIHRVAPFEFGQQSTDHTSGERMSDHSGDTEERQLWGDNATADHDHDMWGPQDSWQEPNPVPGAWGEQRTAARASDDVGPPEDTDSREDKIEGDMRGAGRFGRFPFARRHVRFDADRWRDFSFDGLKHARCSPARCPLGCACCNIILFVVIIVVGVVAMPMTIETDFDSFMKTDVNSSRMRDTFIAALKKRQLEDRRLRATQLFKHFDLVIAYEIDTNSEATSVFDNEAITQVARYERGLRSSPEFAGLCDMAYDSYKKDNPAEIRKADSDKFLCEYGISLINYALPTRQHEGGSVVPHKIRFDGLAEEVVPLEVTLGALERNGVDKILFPQGFEVSSASSTTEVRTAFRFKFFCCTSMDSVSKQRAVVADLKAKWEHLSENIVLPYLQDEGKTGDLPVKVWYTGEGIESLETLQTLFRDVALATGSMGFVLLYLVFHTRSFFLGLIGLLVVMMSVPLAYVIFAVIAGTQTMTIASFLSLFLIVGLGSDVVFVYTDFWRDAERHDTTEKDRIIWVLRHAGKASLATTATTAVSFFANLASVLKPLREFGMFMGLCVSFAWILVTLIYLPLCAVDARIFGCCRLGFPAACSAPHGREVWHKRAFGYLTAQIQRFRCVVIFVSVVLWVVALICAITNATTDSSIPNIFPADHNQNRGKEVLERFAPISNVMDSSFSMPSVEEEACQEWDFDTYSCLLYWCEVDSRAPRSAKEQCSCYRKPLSNCRNAGAVVVKQRIVGPSLTTIYEALGGVADRTVNGDAPGLRFRSDPTTHMTLDPLASLVLQEWETGEVELRPMSQIESTVYRADAESSCGFEEICFCETYNCRLSADWVEVTPLPMPLPPEQEEDGARRLQQEDAEVVPGAAERSLVPWSRMLATRVKRTRRANVEVVFGVKVEMLAPLLGNVAEDSQWSFLESFDLSQPWAQRNLYSFCENIPDSLRVVHKHTLCWIKDFRNWVTEAPRNGRFPLTRDVFHNMAGVFLQVGLTGSKSSKDFVWLQGRTIMASFFNFECDFDKNVGASQALEYKDAWDEYVNTWNALASRYGRGAWHTSPLWVRAEAQKELISSTIATLLIVIGLAFLGMLLFTFDPILSLLVVMCTLGVVCGLAFFITTMMQWPIGPIEVIALIVFIGYAVTYSLHIAHKYGGHGALELGDAVDMDDSTSIRIRRTEFALKSIGMAALGSAVTTTGCSMFLLFCTLTIFKKLGGVVLAVTLMSIVTALGSLPAILLVAGPVRPGLLRLPNRETITNAHSTLLMLIKKWSRKTGDDATTALAGSVVIDSKDAVSEVPRAHSKEVAVEAVRLEERDFDIGTESPLEPIWARQVDSSTKRVVTARVPAGRGDSRPRGGTSCPVTPRSEPFTPRAAGVPKRPEPAVSPNVVCFATGGASRGFGVSPGPLVGGGHGTPPLSPGPLTGGVPYGSPRGPMVEGAVGRGSFGLGLPTGPLIAGSGSPHPNAL